jgi:glutathione S-transferase
MPSRVDNDGASYRQHRGRRWLVGIQRAPSRTVTMELSNARRRATLPGMILYVDSQFASPYAMSAFVALDEKRVPFVVQTVDLATGANRGAAFARLSMTRRVPALVDGDFTLSESTAIAEYLNETREGPLLYPATPKERARARQIQAWLRSDLAAIRQERSTEVIFYRQRVAEPLSPAAAQASQALFFATSQWLAHGGEHLFGDWCIADADLALMLNRLILNGDDVPAALVRHAEAQWQRPSVQRWVQQRRPPL